MQWLYLIGLIFSIAGMAIIDWRYKLAYWYDRKRTLITVGIGMAVFIVWDLLGIKAGIFFHGNSQFALPFTIIPEFPVEEFFFLLLLCYVTLILYLLGGKLWPRT